MQIPIEDRDCARCLRIDVSIYLKRKRVEQDPLPVQKYRIYTDSEDSEEDDSDFLFDFFTEKYEYSLLMDVFSDSEDDSDSEDGEDEGFCDEDEDDRNV